MKLGPRRIAADRRAEAVLAEVVGVRAVVDVRAVAVGATTIRATRANLESRAGNQQYLVVQVQFSAHRTAEEEICQKNVTWRCLCLVEAVPASPSVRKSAHGRKNRRKRPSARSSDDRKSPRVDPTNLPLKTSRRRPNSGPCPGKRSWKSRQRDSESDEKARL